MNDVVSAQSLEAPPRRLDIVEDALAAPSASSAKARRIPLLRRGGESRLHSLRGKKV